MGYRDDVGALESQRDIIKREVDDLSGRLAKASEEGEKLRKEVYRKRLRIRLLRVRRWAARHPKTVALVLIVVVGGGYLKVRSWLKERERAAEVARVLGTGCETRLKVTSRPPARLLVDALEVGRTPVDVPICRGTYLLRLAHRRALPWQRRIAVSGRDVKIQAGLIPHRPRDRPKQATLFVTDPPNLLLFVNGQELGITPVFARWDLLRSSKRSLAYPSGAPAASLRIGVWSPGRRPVTLLARRRPVIWLQLGPAGAGGRGQGRRRGGDTRANPYQQSPDPRAAKAGR